MNEKPKAYVVKMSVKNGDVKIDADEVARVIQGIINGQPIKVRQGIVNPSFYVGIYEDVERVSGFIRELNDVIGENDRCEKYGIGRKRSLPAFKKLSDIFEGLQLPSGNKQITN